MSNVVGIEEQMPLGVIVGPSNQTHVISIEAIKRMADGRNKLINEGQEESDIDLIQGIIDDWLMAYADYFD